MASHENEKLATIRSTQEDQTPKPPNHNIASSDS